MWKNRLGYILVMVTCAVLLFFYSKPFLLYSMLIMVGVGVMLLVFLCRDAKNINAKMRIHPAARQGRTVKLHVDTECHRMVLAAGYVLIEVKIYNEMFDMAEMRRILLNLNNKNDCYEIPVETQLCGGIRVECENIWYYDIFKLFRVKGKIPEQIRMVVYPKEVEASVEISKNFVGVSQEEEMIQNRKGNDPSETFDIREYVPGDDVRSIHWKLSSKTDTLILREASDPTHYQMIIMPDFGLDQIETMEAREEINMAAALGNTLCRQLVRKGISFCMAFPTGNGLKLMEVRGNGDYQKMRAQWMGLRIQSNSGNGLRLFMTEHLERCFTKLLILSAGQFEQNLGSLDGQVSVTVLNVSKDHQEMTISRNGTCEIAGFPAVQEENTTYRIMC